MTLDDFDFDLPPAQVAQTPVEPRDAARLMVLQGPSAPPLHRRFEDLVELVRPGDLLVVNDAKVIPARLLGRKAGTGGKAELLLVRPAAAQPVDGLLERSPEAVSWICLGQASKGLKPGQELEFDGGLRALVEESMGEGEVRVQLRAPPGTSLEQVLGAAGRLPLPPYIERPPDAADAERYQTVYARARGSVAAPTAGLHFTPGLLATLEAKGALLASVTLDVGPGTFLPVRETDVERHKMHTERYAIPEETARRIAATRASGGRVIAVGTTVVRTLESATEPASGSLRAGPGASALFIRPGFVFRQVDALITNFHLPRSTLLMLVSAFAGRPRVLEAYREAVSRGYRFFSYGDAMFLTP